MISLAPLSKVLPRLRPASEAAELSLPRSWAVVGLLALAVIAMLVQGGVFIHKTWLWTGDTIYHRALMAEILNGELLPGGPYAGLPAFYSPLLHYLAAGLAALLHIDPLEGVRLLSIAASPLTPLAAYFLARTLGFDRVVALVGAFCSTFGGGWRIAPDRVWVDSLFVGQHNFFPLFPRDIAFLLLPLGFACFYRGLVHNWRPGAPLAGLALGVMILAHTQTAFFAAPVLGLYLLLLLVPRRDLFARMVRLGMVVSAIALAVSSFWWVWMLVSIIQSRDFGVHMPASRVPIKLPLQEVPLEFGLFLPLGILGIVMTARRLLRQRDLGSLLLLVWWAAPTIMAIARPTDFPGGDTFFPRRLWQFASQPLMIMAAYGLAHGLMRRLVLARPLAAGAWLAIGVLAAVPASWGTWQRVAEFWNTPSFADRDWDLDGNFAFGAWLADRARAEGPKTVISPIPEATMVWYYAGDKLLYLYPTAAIKLAFNVERMTGRSELDRRTDLGIAYGGDPAQMAQAMLRYQASYLVVKRQDDHYALVDLPPRAIRTKGGPTVVETNHFEYLNLGKEDDIASQIYSPRDQTATLSMRLRRQTGSGRVAGVITVNGTSYELAEGELARESWVDVTRQVALKAGLNDVRFEARADFYLERIVAYIATAADLAAIGLRPLYQDDWYAVLGPAS
ncbi:MAG: hypothetical protein IT307_12680 [Chloroflexi bacterium]|nr:hypothetical protein [Chloroflexota bacterium]